MFFLVSMNGIISAIACALHMHKPKRKVTRMIKKKANASEKSVKRASHFFSPFESPISSQW